MLHHDDLKTRLVAPSYLKDCHRTFSNQINKFVMLLIETIGQKTKSETLRPRNQKFESEMQSNTRKRDFETHSKYVRDFEIGTKFSKTLNFPGTIYHPSFYHQLSIH